VFKGTDADLLALVRREKIGKIGKRGREEGQQRKEEKRFCTSRHYCPLTSTFYPPLPPSLPHRYHHVTVLSFTWAAYGARHPGVYFIAMNYTVHAIMYSYFFLMAINAKPKWLK